MVKPAYEVESNPTLKPAYYEIESNPTIKPAYEVESNPTLKPAYYEVESNPTVKPAYGVETSIVRDLDGLRGELLLGELTHPMPKGLPTST